MWQIVLTYFCQTVALPGYIFEVSLTTLVWTNHKLEIRDLKFVF